MAINPIERLQDTRDQILAVAARLFAERGFANVSIRDICDTAGVTPPTIYHYFGNKDRLFQEVIRRTLSLKDFRIALLAKVNDQKDPESQLTAFIGYYLTQFPRGFFNPGMFLQDTTNLSLVSTERVMEEFQAINELAEKILQEGMDRGAFMELDLELATLYLMNLLMSFILGEVHYFQRVNFREAAPFIAELFLSGIRCSDRKTP